MINEKLQEKLRAKYSPDGSTLRIAQLQMLDILKCVDKICRKYNIPYWLSSGTLLGAVRHGGFIPWDDDLDIEMLKEDYEKLIPILKQELPTDYMLQDNTTEKNYPFLFAKVRSNKSQIKESFIYKLKNEGLYIDIFPLEKSFYCLFKLSAVLYHNFCIKLYKHKYIFYLNRFIHTQIIFPFFRILSKLHKSDTIRHTYGIGFLKARQKSDIFPLSEIRFEDSLFYAPKNSDTYLKRIYGDYMNLPNNIQTHGTIHLE